MNLNITATNLHSISRIANPKSCVTGRETSTLRRYLFLSLLILAICFLTPLQASGADTTPGLKLIASVAPQEYLLNKLKTPESSVRVVIRPGQSPTTWDPSPRQMQEIVSADIMFPIGVPFEQIWLPRLRQRAPNLIIADTLAGIRHIPMEHRHHHGGADQADIDPHIWLDPVLCIRMAENMVASLQQVDPAQHQFYAERLKQLRAELEKLHHDISDILMPLKQRTFMVFHPSWGYFAARYSLHQIAMEKDGKEPSGAHLAHLIELARREEIKVIFVQEQFSTKAARAIASQTGAQIQTLDPLAANLAESLRNTAKALARSLTP